MGKTPCYRLGHLLREKGLVTSAQLDYAVRLQRRQPGMPLGAILIAEGIIDEAQLKSALRQQSALKFYAACLACVMAPFQMCWANEKPESVPDWQIAKMASVNSDVNPFPAEEEDHWKRPFSQSFNTLGDNPYEVNFNVDNVNSSNSGIAVGTFMLGCAYKMYQNASGDTGQHINPKKLPVTFAAGKINDTFTVQVKIHF